jgi:DUF218 domain
MDVVFGRLYKYLNAGEAVRPADCIFVLAGRQERKVYGIDLWKRGFAPELILSVTRFEWRKFYDLGLSMDGGLKQMVAATAPAQRHFFIRVRAESADCHHVQPGWFGTWREARALACLLGGGPVRSILIVSDGLHLKRVAFAMQRAFRKQGVRLSMVPVSNLSGAKSSPRALESRSAVLKEFCKYIAYRVIFCSV